MVPGLGTATGIGDAQSPWTTNLELSLPVTFTYFISLTVHCSWHSNNVEKAINNQTEWTNLAHNPCDLQPTYKYLARANSLQDATSKTTQPERANGVEPTSTAKKKRWAGNNQTPVPGFPPHTAFSKCLVCISFPSDPALQLFQLQNFACKMTLLKS
jgi:hypothetical protein